MSQLLLDAVISPCIQEEFTTCTQKASPCCCSSACQAAKAFIIWTGPRIRHGAWSDACHQSLCLCKGVATKHGVADLQEILWRMARGFPFNAMLDRRRRRTDVDLNTNANYAGNTSTAQCSVVLAISLFQGKSGPICEGFLLLGGACLAVCSQSLTAIKGICALAGKTISVTGLSLLKDVQVSNFFLSARLFTV